MAISLIFKQGPGEETRNKCRNTIATDDDQKEIKKQSLFDFLHSALMNRSIADDDGEFEKDI